MILGCHRQQYEALQQSLSRLQADAAEDNADWSFLQAHFSETQALFQSKILSLDLEDLDAVEAAQIQSYQTEINKQLRLLGMDMMFLKAARQSATRQQRLTQIGDRLKLLLHYCDAVLQPNQASDPSSD